LKKIARFITAYLKIVNKGIVRDGLNMLDAKISKGGTLLVKKLGSAVFRNHICGTNTCGDWCPHFDEYEIRGGKNIMACLACFNLVEDKR